jgi:DNA mismatch endonuclease Vsr
MARVRRSGTQPELTVREILSGIGLKFECQAQDLPGTPDIVIRESRLAIFVHGCFWHGHSKCRLSKIPKTRTQFWQAKIEANRQRDVRKERELRALGWTPIAVWQCELRDQKQITRRFKKVARTTKRAKNMAKKQDTEWVFETSPLMGGASGEAFTNTLLSSGMSPAEVLARESIQNSVDASSKGSSVQVRYRAVELKGADKKTFVAAAALPVIRDRADSLRLVSPHCLESLDQKTPLRLLFIEDYNTVGLDGDEPHNPSSRFYRFLLSLGDGGKAEADESSGGSFGYGKSVYCSNSSISTIFAYSRFRDGKGKSRSRLFGSSYFKTHLHNKKSYTGRAWFGLNVSPNADSQVVDPLVDESADELAEKLGFTKRGTDEFGLSVLVVDSTVEPEDILSGAEEWWWPRLIDDQLSVQVVKPDGTVAHPRPRKKPHLVPFINAYEVAIGRSPGVPKREAKKPFRAHDTGLELGACGFCVLPPEGEDRAVEEDRIDTVALIREPKMVVAYHKSWMLGSPSVVGVYVAHPDVDNILRLSEPPAHDRWDKGSRRLYGVGVKRDVVASILSRIHTNLKTFQREASPPSSPKPKRLALLERALAKFLTGKKGAGGGPEPGRSPIHLQYDVPPYAEPIDGMLRAKAKFSVRLMDDAKIAHATLRLRLTCPVIEDDAEGDSISVFVKASKGTQLRKDADTGTYLFDIKRDQVASFSIETEGYEPLWSVRLTPEVEPVDVRKEES